MDDTKDNALFVLGHIRTIKVIRKSVVITFIDGGTETFIEDDTDKAQCMFQKLLGAMKEARIDNFSTRND